eukprot:10815381-Karenia_brevis.AAC.1
MNDDESVSEKQKVAYWSLVGGIAWTLVTRADVAVYCGYLQRNSKDPKIKHIKQCNRLLRHMKRTSCKILYKEVPEPHVLYNITDSAYRAQDVDCLALRAVIIALGTDDGKLGGDVSVLEFYSRKLRVVARSTYAAELRSLCDSMPVALYIATFLHEIQNGPQTAEALSEVMNNGKLS